MDKKILVKIGVPVLVVLLVAGVWLLKNKETSEPVIADIQNQAAAGTSVAAESISEQGPDNPLIKETTMEATSGTPALEKDPNFTLHAEKIDLDVLSAYKLPMILDFGSDDCIPCKQMAPVLKSMNAEMQGKAIIRFVDVWKQPNGAEGFPVQVIPTQVLINADGKPYVPSETIMSAGIRLTKYVKTDTNEHMFTVHQGGLTEEQMRLILKDMGVV